ncbi:MAG: glycosyltransferase family 4 protein [Blastocatellia bacterium]
MRLTLVIHSLQGGGAERMMTLMANYWAAAGWSITLLTMDKGSAPLFYALDNRVHSIPLDVASRSKNAAIALQNNLKRINALRHAISATRPDVVLSFMDKTNVLTLLATRGLNIPVVVSERSDPAMNHPGRVWANLRRLTYRMADAVAVQSKGAMNYFPAKIQARARIIPNPVSKPSACGSRAVFENGGMSIVAMGRLVRAKGFDLLLEAFAQVKDSHSSWNLIILGEGPLRKELESLRDSLELTDRVLMPGRVNNTYERLAGADIFVTSSRYEGFPNSLCEAMASGVAVIATDCPSGPREIIRDNVDGLLVANADPKALASAMNRLMSNDTERKRLALRASEVTKRFAVERIMPMWEEVFVQAIKGTEQNENHISYSLS